MVEYNSSTGFFKRFRADFRCGEKNIRLPDDSVVECDPVNGAPCCSALGWCGSSKQHCACNGCVSYFEPTKYEYAANRECSKGVLNLNVTSASIKLCAQKALTTEKCG